MTDQERLLFFHQLVCTNYPVSLWSYDADFHLQHTSSTWNLISVSDFIPTIQKHLQEHGFSPFVLETRVGLLWIVGFSHDGPELKGIHFLGPMLTGRDALSVLKQKMEGYRFPNQTEEAAYRIIAKTPVLPSAMLFSYATMFHYALNEEAISLAEVSFSTPESRPDSRNRQSISPDSLWKEEERLCHLFETGSGTAVDATIAMLSVTSGIQSNLRDSVRTKKNNALALLVLCSRACIRGGLHPAKAYELQDYYAYHLEISQTTGEVIRCCKDMISDYMSHMQSELHLTSLSPSIQNICYYIQSHLSENISVDTLARMAGYTEYYLTHKFQAETGITIREYILREKVSRAKVLLCDSSQRIQDVSDALGFCNSNYFSVCFKKQTGVSPREYKAQNARI